MSGSDDSLLTFPADLPIKVFGRNDPDFRSAVREIFDKHFGSAYATAEQTSREGTYVSITITVRAETRAQADAVYQELVAHELILMAL
jgi:putative lipoic acid-binding regulatory protein